MKNIVITGANRGIGLALTKLLSRDNIVYALCRGEFPKTDLTDNIKVIKLDITNEKQIIDFAGELDAEQTAVDLLINNAGIAGGDENENVKTDTSSLLSVYATNVVGPMVATLCLVPALKRSDSPVMIAISSRMGTHAMLDDYNAEWWPYSSSKAALSLAVSAFSLNEPSIKSISVHPGWVKTDMGGDDADISATESAEGIVGLYEGIAHLEPGGLYSYDGTLMDW